MKKEIFEAIYLACMMVTMVCLAVHFLTEESFRWVYWCAVTMFLIGWFCLVYTFIV